MKMTNEEIDKLEAGRELDALYEGKLAVDFGGTRYYFNKVTGYYQSVPYKASPQKLHREVWRAKHGFILPDHDIHHKDGNRCNNDLSNLDCVGHGAHMAYHNKLNRKLPIRPKTFCIAKKCIRQAKARKLCTMHYQRIRAKERGRWL